MKMLLLLLLAINGGDCGADAATATQDGRVLNGETGEGIDVDVGSLGGQVGLGGLGRHGCLLLLGVTM